MLLKSLNLCVFLESSEWLLFFTYDHVMDLLLHGNHVQTSFALHDKASSTNISHQCCNTIWCLFIFHTLFFPCIFLPVFYFILFYLGGNVLLVAQFGTYGYSASISLVLISFIQLTTTLDYISLKCNSSINIWPCQVSLHTHFFSWCQWNNLFFPFLLVKIW